MTTLKFDQSDLSKIVYKRNATSVSTEIEIKMTFLKFLLISSLAIVSAIDDDYISNLFESGEIDYLDPPEEESSATEGAPPVISLGSVFKPKPKVKVTEATPKETDDEDTSAGKTVDKPAKKRLLTVIEEAKNLIEDDDNDDEGLSAGSIALITVCCGGSSAFLAFVCKMLWHIYRAGRQGANLADTFWDYVQLIFARLRHGAVNPDAIPMGPVPPRAIEAP